MSSVIQPTRCPPLSLESLPDDAQTCLASFLRNDELANLRILSRKCSTILGRLDPNPELQEICKQTSKSLNLLQKSLLDLELKRRDLEWDIVFKTASLSKEEKKLTVHRRTWLGWLISELDTENGLIGRINRALKWLFPSFKRAADEQRKMLATIQKLETEKRGLESQKRSNITSIEGIKNEIDSLVTTVASQKSKALIVNLFGNQEAFDRIPVLDVGDREGPTGYIDFIKVSEMTAPIMKGTDKYGRMFLAILAKKDGWFAGRVFFQRHSDTMCHISDAYLEGVQSLVEPHGYLIDRGTISHDPDSKNLKAYRALREMIQTGRAIFEEPSVRFNHPCNRVVFTAVTVAGLNAFKEVISKKANAQLQNVQTP